MPTCVAFGCSNRSNKKGAGVTFHQFPRKPPLREAWVKACRRHNWIPSEWSHLCSDHFSEDQMDRTSLVCVRLRENAVPNIFRAFTPYLQKTEKIRRPSTERKQPFVSTRVEEGIVVTSAKENTDVCSNEPPQQNTTEKLHCKTPLQNATVNINAESCITLMCDSATLPLRNTFALMCDAATSPIKSTPTLMCDAATSPLEINLTDIASKRRLEECEYMITQYRKKIRMLRQQNRRHNKRIKKLTSLLEDLKQKQFVDDPMLQILKTTAGPNEELLTRQLSKLKNKSVPKEYSPQLQEFARTLYLHSPRAYEYVRETFNECLPHSRTISRWHQKVNDSPGLTSEADKANSSQALICSLDCNEQLQ